MSRTCAPSPPRSATPVSTPSTPPLCSSSRVRSGASSIVIEEISQVDGVDVEDVRPVPTPLRDARLDALHTAALLVEQGSVRCLLDRLCEEAHRDFQADWSAVVDLDDAGELACVGEPPSTPWLRAFLAGSGASMPVVTGACGPDDVAWAPLEGAGLALVLGRPSRQFRA